MADTYVEDADVGRRELLKKTAIGGGLVVAALAAPGLTGTAEAKGGKSIVLDVDTNVFQDLQNIPAGGALGAFYVSGTIFAPGTSRDIGTFHCWASSRPMSLRQCPPQPSMGWSIKSST